MGVLVAFGDDANFVVSVGGFHPAFTPPPLPFPTPKRIAISTSSTRRPRASAPTGYFAVTTNTVQFGARAELFFGFGAAASRATRLRRADPVLAVPLHRRDLGVLLGEGLRRRRVRRRRSTSRSRARRRGTRTGTASISFLFFSISRRRSTSRGASAGHDPAADRGAADPRGRARQARELDARCCHRQSSLLVSLRTLDPAEADARAAPGRHAAGQPARGAARPRARHGSAARSRATSTGFTLAVAGRRAREGARLAGAVRAGAVPGLRRRRQALAAAVRGACRRHRARRAAASLRLGATRSRASSATTLTIIDTNYRRFQRRFVRSPALLSRTSSPATRRADRPLSQPRRRRARAVRRAASRCAARRTRSPRRPTTPRVAAAVREPGGGARRTSLARIAADPTLADDAARDPARSRRGRMSTRSATYSFLPWLRQGIANTIAAADGDAGGDARAASTSSCS